MKALLNKLATLAVGMTVLTACSYQYKITDPGATEQEVQETLDRIQQGAVQASGVQAGLIDDLRIDPTNTVYFTRSGTNGLKPETVFSFGDVMPFIGGWAQGIQGPINVFQADLQEVSVGFIDGVSSDAFGNERQFALLIEFLFNDGSSYHYAGVSNPGEYYFDDDMFEVIVTGINGELIALRTFDVHDEFSDTLGDNIQLKAYVIDGNGVEYEIGQFSALAGFGS